jgi:hypothetical protein
MSKKRRLGLIVFDDFPPRPRRIYAAAKRVQPLYQLAQELRFRLSGFKMPHVKK